MPYLERCKFLLDCFEPAFLHNNQAKILERNSSTKMSFKWMSALRAAACCPNMLAKPQCKIPASVKISEECVLDTVFNFIESEVHDISSFAADILSATVHRSKMLVFETVLEL